MTDSQVCYQDLRAYKYRVENEYHQQVTGKLIPKEVAEVRRDSDQVLLLKLTPLGELTIYEGYAWDGPSGPTVDTPSFMRGSLVHDALYQLLRDTSYGEERKARRKAADKLLSHMCRIDGMGRLAAWVVYRGVRWFGESAASPGGGVRAKVCAPLLSA